MEADEQSLLVAGSPSSAVYDDRVSQPPISRRIGPTFAIVWPTSWWLVQHAFASQLPDWNHDVRFFDAYWIPATFYVWLHQKTGWWWGQSYWVGLQDAVVGFVAAMAIAHVLVRQRAWQAHSPIRAAAALAGVLCPWYPFLLYASIPGYYRVGVYSLCAAYLVATTGGLVLPVGRGVRISLLIVAVLVGVSMSSWLFDLRDWEYWASLLAPFFLLLVSTRRLIRNEGVV